MCLLFFILLFVCQCDVLLAISIIFELRVYDWSVLFMRKTIDALEEAMLKIEDDGALFYMKLSCLIFFRT